MSTRPETRLMTGTAAGSRCADPVGHLEQPVGQQVVVEPCPPAGQRVSGAASTRSLVFTCIRSRVREPVGVDVVVGVREVESAADRLLPRHRRSCARSRNSGSTWKVTVVRIPSAPSPTRATSSTSAFSVGDARSTSPVAGHQLQPGELRRQRRAARPPVPWVPVETAPASVCSAMSPMLCSESPSRSSSSLRTWSGVPARAVTVIASRSTDDDPGQLRSGSSIVCSGAAIAVKL